MTKPKPLTGKQKLFVEHYAATLNGTKAARLAGYKGSDATLAVAAHKLLRLGKIKDEVEKRFKGAAMGADECLARIADHAKSKSPQALRALELVGKAHSLFVDRVEHSGRLNVSEMTDEELRKIAGRD